jgi:hypothetical protein
LVRLMMTLQLFQEMRLWWFGMPALSVSHLKLLQLHVVEVDPEQEEPH